MPDHKTKDQVREITEHICDEPTCEFYGLPTQQGACHTTEPDVADIDKLYQVAEDFQKDLLEFHREIYGKDKDEYIAYLESMYECAMLNWTFGLDETVRLRKENALLKLKLRRLEKP